MRTKSLIFVGLMVCVSLIFAGFGSTAFAVKRTDVLVIGMRTGDAVSLDPAKAYEFSSSGTVNQLYDKLVDLDVKDLTKPVPELAESWEIGPDGKKWIFHIRKGVKFPSGDPVDAKAVAFSLKRLVKLADTPSWVITQFGVKEDSIRVMDDYTVEVTLDQQYAPGVFLSCLAYTVGSIVDPKLAMAHEKEGDMGRAWMADHSAGCGPYILEKWERQAQMVLKANENYWKGPPPFKRIIIRDVPEPTNQMILLEKGDIDLAWDLLPDQAKALKKSKDVVISECATFYVRYMGMNVGFEPLGHPKVRDAIRYAIDYDGIIDEIVQGAGIMGQTVIPKGMLGYNPATPYSTDIEKAKKLLGEAGYPNGFEVELVTPPASPFVDTATKVQSDLAKVGIKVKVVQMIAAQMYEKYRAQKLQMVMAQWGSDYVDPDANAKPFAHSNSIGPDAKIKQLAWRNKYLNVETSKLVDQAGMELDVGKRKDMYKKLTDIILDDGPFAVLYYPVKQYGVRKEVKNFVPPQSFFLFDFTTLRKEAQ
jgi:peptide/nickel transport system substrate-binding protein